MAAMSKKNAAYSNEEIAMIANLLRQKWTAGQIAKKLGNRSRNAIIGVVHRDKRLRAIGLAHTPPPMRKGVPVPKAGTLKTDEPVWPDGVPFLELKDIHCRWPLWSEALHIPVEHKKCCGKLPARGYYCEAHARMMWPAHAARGGDSDRKGIGARPKHDRNRVGFGTLGTGRRG
jgi:GcrA cell cycle regulator